MKNRWWRMDITGIVQGLELDDHWILPLISDACHLSQRLVDGHDRA